MTRAHIQTRIWLSIGIFVLGFLLTTIISQVERTRGERVLATVADAVLPAAQQGRDAEMAFQRVVQAYLDTFPMGDRTDLERADFEGARALEALHRIGATPGISSERASSARRLAVSLNEFLAEADTAYGSFLSLRKETTPGLQDRFRRLAVRTTSLKTSLESLATGLSSDLQPGEAAGRRAD